METKSNSIILAVFTIILLFMACGDAKAQSFNFSNNVYTEVESQKAKSQPEKTSYTWQDSKGKSYPMYIGKTGSCFVLKTSSKTGKEYKMYLKPKISQDVCRKMNREYKPRGKSQASL